ncbi:hypothetical protein [Kordiimonas lacus]|uniref:Uncharacterized protein n=1 Tax=Kordiimonas lacus TaxID=637679 RepID=A0A1G7CBV4_9PROT|nr:hypothetical protein [Kordiimonas lacus]SDE36220.1 hypothetical protein SAMN04488071_2720 [Kordiimonas lacus]
MSRWLDQFKGSQFVTIWKNLGDLTKGIDLRKVTNFPEKKELARFVKAFRYVDSFIKACDPELIPQALWNNCQTPAANCNGQFANYVSSRNTAYLEQANASVDQILVQIQPYQKLDGKAVRSARASFIQYAKTLESAIKDIEEKSSGALSQIAANATETGELLATSLKNSSEINQLKDEYFEGCNGEPALKQQVSELLSELTENQERFGNYHRELFGEAEKDGIVKEIAEARSEAQGNRQQIQEILKTCDKELEELSEFYHEAFGQENEEGKIEGGLKNELQEKIQAYKDLAESHQKKFAAFEKRIEDLLPGATSAGLASAYADRRKTFEDPIKFNSRLFYAAMAGLFVIGFIFSVESIGEWPLKFTHATNLSELGSSFLLKLPFLGPLIWLAVFASKRRSEAQRLEQEYAHKEALAKSYESFKQQIHELGQENDVIMEQLLEAAIRVVAYNASATLDGKHGDKVPLQEAIERAVPVVKGGD